jgi:hypothetical protein
MFMIFFVLSGVSPLIANLWKRNMYDAACDYRRRWARYKLAVPLKTLVHVHGISSVEGHSSLISQGGLCLFAAAELPVGGVVDMLLTHPCSGAPVRVRGSIRNRSMYLYGVEFLVESALPRIELARLCEVSNTSGLIAS